MLKESKFQQTFNHIYELFNFQKYWYISPLEFFENENFDGRASARAARARAETLDLDF